MDSKDKEIKRIKIELEASKLINEHYEETLKQEREVYAKQLALQAGFASKLTKFFEKSLGEVLAAPEEENKGKPYFDYDSHYICFACSDMPQCIYNVHRQCTAPSDSWEASHCRCRYLNGCPEEEEEEEKDE